MSEETEILRLKRETAPHRGAQAWRSIGQLSNTLLPFGAIWYLMLLSLERSYLLTLLLAPVAAGLVVRMFIIEHDCGHGSFFESRRANEIIGTAMSLFTLTPFEAWRTNHILHHATSGNLEERGIGYFELMTAREFRAASPTRRWFYRIYRHPLTLFVIGPAILFGLSYRFHDRAQGRRERISVYVTNLLLVLRLVVVATLVGWKRLFLVEVPIVWWGSVIGVWLFYVQHHFEGGYWEVPERWDFVRAALQGSSYYKLPRILQWFTGNIGFHHVHHFDAKIPNYRLEACHYAVRVFRDVRPITFAESVRATSFRLWDEDRAALVGFDEGHVERIEER
jgi:omega-6 fatty acid desaturase (delta-12 desaturase)